MMKRKINKLLAVLISIIMISGMVSFNAGAAGIVNVTGKTVAQIQSEIDPLLGSGTVTVTGVLSGATTTLVLNILAGVTVDWQATYKGTASPLIDLKGNGNFNVTGGEIANESGSSYTAIRANAADNDQGVQILVSGGKVWAGLGTAIEGAGKSTTVTVTGGEVYNSATNNLRPVINMTNLTPDRDPNVTISNGTVSANAKSTGAYGYAIQTYGNVVVSGGVVFTTGDYGRGINIVGVDSVATINIGATIYATGVSGVAISTATTAGVDVTNTKVIVNGGLVYANAGMAIRTTGKSSTIAVNGGLVIAYGTGITGNNNVIFAQNNVAAGFTGVTGGVAIAWNQAAGRTDYEKDSTTHIIISSSGGAATAKWNNNPPPGKDGILYVNGGSTRHLGFGNDLEGFTPVHVHEYSATVSPEEFEFHSVAEWRSSEGGVYSAPNLAHYPAPLQPAFTPKLFDIENNGTDTLNLTATLAGGAGSAFEIVAPATFTVADGGIETVSVIPKNGYLLRPEPYTVTDTLIITDSGGNIPPLKVDLSLTVLPTIRVISTHAGRGGGDITPGPVTDIIYGGASPLYIITPSPSYRFDYFEIRDPNTPSPSEQPMYALIGIEPVTPPVMPPLTASYQIPVVTRGYIIIPVFTPIGSPHAIIAFAGEDGYFDKPLRTTIHFDDDPMDFIVTARDGYIISDVRVNGDTALDKAAFTPSYDASKNLISGVYTFTDMSKDYWITATFERLHKINVSHNTGGIVSLGQTGVDVQGNILVHDGDSLTFEAIPTEGFRIGSVQVDSSSRASNTFPFIEFPNVSRDYIVVVNFVPLDSGGGSNDEPSAPEPEPEPPKKPGDVGHILNTTDHIRYIGGVGDNLFEPERFITRAEAAQMFFNLLVEQDVELTKHFPDETEGAWYVRAVDTLATLGIIEGYTDGEYHPDGYITRAEFVTMAVRFAHELPDLVHDIRFDDVPDEHWAFGYINAAGQFGWVIGYEDGHYRPEWYISRAHAVTVVNRMLNRIADEEYIDSHPEMKRFVDVPQSHWAFYRIMEAYNAHHYEWNGDAERWTGLRS